MDGTLLNHHMLKAVGLSAILAIVGLSLLIDVDSVVASVEHAGLAHFVRLVLLKNTN